MKRNASVSWSTSDVIDQFISFLENLGFERSRLGSVMGDGRRHRVFVRTAKGRLVRDGVYCLYLDGWPAGWAQCHAGGGELQTWRYTPTVGQRFDDRAIIALRQQEARAAAERAVERARECGQAQARAATILGRSQPASPDHPYLARKGIRPHGVCAYREMLIVPVRNINNMLMSLQLIRGDGSKIFLRGGMTDGGMHVLGNIDQRTIVLIGEGFSTMATCREATGLPAVISFNCGNLPRVAASIRKRYPLAPIIICADDDWRTRRPNGELYNPGIEAARKAAACGRALIAYPDWAGQRPDKATDFNDLALGEGLSAVTSAILRAGKDTGAA